MVECPVLSDWTLYFVRKKWKILKLKFFRGEEIDYRKLGKLLYRGFFIVEKDKKFVITDEFFNVITKGMFDEIKPAFRNHF